MTERQIKPDDAKEALLRAATYLKWFRDGGITVDTKVPFDINNVIATLERIANRADLERLVVELGSQDVS